MIELKDFKFILHFFNGIRLPQVIKWLGMIPTYFSAPRTFFDKYYAQNTINKLRQLGIYCSLLILLLVLWLSGSIVDFTRLLLSMLVLAIPLAIILYITARIVKTDKANFRDILSFVYFNSIFGTFLTFLFNGLFIKNEDYTFQLIANCLSTIAVLISIFGYWYIARVNWKKSLLAISLTVILINLTFVLLSIINIGGSNKSISGDPFITEFDYHTERLKDFGGLPFTRTIIHEHGAGTSDSLSLINHIEHKRYHYGQNDIKALKDLAQINVKTIDSVLPKIRFTRNKYMLTELRNYYDLFGSMFDYPPCDTCLVKVTKWMSKDSVVKKYAAEYVIDSPYLKNRVHFEQALTELQAEKEKSEIPFTLTALVLAPYYYFGEKFAKGTISKNISL